jgi:DNA-binding PadR family transcriptional regulator
MFLLILDISINDISINDYFLKMSKHIESFSSQLNEPIFFILLSLASGPKHGYAILKDVEDISAGKICLSTSTLYTALARLQNQKIIEREEAGEAETGPGLPRKIYNLTRKGKLVLNAEAHRLQNMLTSYRLRLGEEKL